MTSKELTQKSTEILHRLCVEIANRSVGSEGNREATLFFSRAIRELGWETDEQEFNALDWRGSIASLEVEGQKMQVLPSPYSNGCTTSGTLQAAASVEELEQADLRGKILLLHDGIAGEQLMPKNFMFYNPEEHQRIIALLEKGCPNAIICATGKNSALAGGAYPFPLIEDGDFNIPSVYMTDVEGQKLLPYLGKMVTVKSDAERIPGKGYNVTARKGTGQKGRVLISAHIDAKKGTPGAIDNATGVTVLMLLADLLKEYTGKTLIELAAFNGEDYYAVPGQMLYLEKMQGRFGEVRLNINIDGAAFKESKTAFSFYGLPEDLQTMIRGVLSQEVDFEEGPQWVQGDHSIFIQQGCPAVAVTSSWFSEHMDDQSVTHTPNDNLSIVDFRMPAKIALTIADIVEKMDNLN